MIGIAIIAVAVGYVAINVAFNGDDPKKESKTYSLKTGLLNAVNG